MSPQGRELDDVLASAQGEPAVYPLAHQPPDFNLLAPLYRWMEWLSFGPWLGWCRCAFLGDLRCARHALVLGDGDGRFTARLLRANPRVQVQAVDASAAMLHALLCRAAANAERVRIACRDVRAWRAAPHPAYDLIVTHFFLDCLTTDEVRALAAHARLVSAPRAQWAVSEFAIPPTRWGRRLARPLVASLYWAFGVLTGLKVRRLPDHRAALAEAGWALAKQRPWLGGLLVSELWIRATTPATR